MSSLSHIRRNVDAFLVRHPRFQAAENEIEEIIAAGRSCGEADCVMITGPAGTGKTTLRRLIARAHPPIANGRAIRQLGYPSDIVADHVPVVVIEMPSQPRPRALLEDILRALGDPRWNKCVRTGDTSAKLDDFLSFCGTVTIVIDEAQRLVDRAGALTSEAVLEELKRLHGLHGISLVLMGLGRMRRILGQDAQLRDRWSAEFRLEPFQCFSREDIGGRSRLVCHERDWLEWRGVLECLQNVAAIPTAEPLSGPDLAKRLFVASQGVMRRLKILVRRALMISEREGMDVIDLSTLQRAFDRQGRQSFNPFSPEFPEDFEIVPVDDDRELQPSSRARRSPKRLSPGPGQVGSAIARLLTGAR